MGKLRSAATHRGESILKPARGDRGAGSGGMTGSRRASHPGRAAPPDHIPGRRKRRETADL
jgi:hypothetical protein